MADAKLSTLLYWVSSHVKDFPFNGPLLLEAWQAVGQRLFNIARDGDAEACGHLITWGTIMAAMRENHTNGGHFVPSDPKPSAPPEPQD